MLEHQIDIQSNVIPNLSLLTQQLKASLADCTGAGFANDTMIVSVTFAVDPVPDQDIATAQQIVTAHDPSQKTTDQQQTATIAAARAHTLSVVIPTLQAKIAYYKAVPAADIQSGAALANLLADFGTFMAATLAWITTS